MDGHGSGSLITLSRAFQCRRIEHNPPETSRPALRPQELCNELQIPGLSAYGMTEAKIAEAVEKGQKSSSMKGNPVPLTEAELKEVLVRSM